MHKFFRRLAAASLASVAIGCGQGTHSVSSPSSAATPPPSASPAQDTAAALRQAATAYAARFAQTNALVRAALVRGDTTTAQRDALAVLRTIDAFRDALVKITVPASAKADAAALITANGRMGAVFEAVIEATTSSEITTAFSQLPAAQRQQQARFNQLAVDVGLSPAPAL